MEKKIVLNLNSYLADLVVFYLKLHDLHWNVKGRQFVEVHKFTERVYEEVSEKFDAVAEKMIMLGVKPISSIKEYLENASIKELGKEEYRDGEVLLEVLSDMKHLRDEALKLRSLFDENGIFQVVNLLDGDLEGYDKDIWFLEAMVK